MTTEPNTASAPPRRRPNPRRIEVLRVRPLSPHMVRITFTGPDLHEFGWSGPAAHLKLIVPADGSHQSEMLTADGPRPENIRTYTPRRFDAASGQLDIDFVLHDHGPAGRWAMRAQPGDRLVVMGPAPGYKIDAEAQWFVLAGDATALPAIETILAELPPQARAQVLLEVEDDGEIRALQSAAAAVDVRWLSRAAGPQPAGVLLETALRNMAADLPAGPGRIYVGCEATALRRIRAFLLKERGLDRKTILTRGYWKFGSANHPDGDYAEDVA